MTAYLHVGRGLNGETKILHVSGELDIASAPTLERVMVGVAPVAEDGEICLDLRGLSFCDSSGARSLLNTQKSVESRGYRIIYASPQPQVRKVLEVFGLDQVCRSPLRSASAARPYSSRSSQAATSAQ